MGLPVPILVGGVEIQERRPKYWNEPRRQRLSFVRSHKKHSDRKDDWAVVPRNQTQANRYYALNEQDRWDLRQLELRRRFAQLDQYDRNMQLHFEHQLRQLQAPMPHQQPRQIPLEPCEEHDERHSHHGGHPDARAHRRDQDDNMASESGSDRSCSSDDDDGGNSGSDDNHHHGSRHARIFHIKPKIVNHKGQLRIKDSKRRGSRRRSCSPDSDSDSNASVSRAFNHAVKRGRGPSKSRPRSGVMPTRVIYGEDDRCYSSDDSFDSYRSQPGRSRLRK